LRLLSRKRDFEISGTGISTIEKLNIGGIEQSILIQAEHRFNQNKIVIAAHSWGSVIGLSLAAKIPDKLHAYVGISLIINWPENDRLFREWAINEARKRGHKKAVNELIQLGEPPYIENFQQWGQLRKWLMKYNSMIYKDKEIQPPSFLNAVKIMLHSPDYTLKDIYNSLYKRSCNRLTKFILPQACKTPTSCGWGSIDNCLTIDPDRL